MLCAVLLLPLPRAVKGGIVLLLLLHLAHLSVRDQHEAVRQLAKSVHHCWSSNRRTVRRSVSVSECVCVCQWNLSSGVWWVGFVKAVGPFGFVYSRFRVSRSSRVSGC